MSKIKIEKYTPELEFEKAFELRNFEIDLFWKRAWFIGALLVAIGGGYFELVKHHDTEFRIYLSFLAFIISVAQCLMNRGSKYWQERWEYKTANKEQVSDLNIRVTKDNIYYSSSYENQYREKDLIEAYILAKKESAFLRATRFSVSKLAIMIWDIIMIFLFFLWIIDFFNCIIFGIIFWQVIIALFIHFIVIVYVSVSWKKVYYELGKNLKPIEKGTPKRNEITYKELEIIYPAGELKDW